MRIVSICDLPEDFNSSGANKSVKSGSSPYQNIHNSLAAVNDKGGCITEPPLPETGRLNSNILPV